MENTNQNPKQYDESAKQKQKEYNRKLEDKGGAALNAPETRGTTKDPDNDTGYKQNEAEEMGGETTRKQVEENKEKGAEEGGAKDSHGVSIGESGNITAENDITENTKERATVDLTGRSVI